MLVMMVVVVVRRSLAFVVSQGLSVALCVGVEGLSRPPDIPRAAEALAVHPKLSSPEPP